MPAVLSKKASHLEQSNPGECEGNLTLSEWGVKPAKTLNYLTCSREKVLSDEIGERFEMEAERNAAIFLRGMKRKS